MMISNKLGHEKSKKGIFGRLAAGFNRDHLSKSIILHHNKNSHLMHATGRYNDDLFI